MNHSQTTHDDHISTSSSSDKQYRVGVHVGSTSTDVVAYDHDSRAVLVAKAPTQTDDTGQCIQTMLKQSGISVTQIRELVLTTRAGEDALLQRQGDRVLLLATAGVADILHIGRGNRTRIIDPRYRKPTPLVPREDIVEIPGRIDAAGSEVEGLGEGLIRAAARRARANGIESIAIAFLFSYLNPEHELRAAAIVSEEMGEVSIALSHRVAREWSEYERTSSTVAEAYAAPVVRRYLDQLEDALRADHNVLPIRLMRASGGTASAAAGRSLMLPSFTSRSAGSAIGAQWLSRHLNRPNIVCLDLGGTTCSVSLIVDGQVRTSTETDLDGIPLLLPAIDTRSIGVGGSSPACLDAGALRLGGLNAGASAAPVGAKPYGTEATLTDANAVLGRLDEASLLGNGLELDLHAARLAIADLADRAGLDPGALALGICDIAVAQLAGAIKTLMLESGRQLKTFTLLAVGGAGPTHAAFLASELGICEVVVPPMPGAFAAWGSLTAEPRADGNRPYLASQFVLETDKLADLLTDLEDETRGNVCGEDTDKHSVRFEHTIDVRYFGDTRVLGIEVCDPTEARGTDFVAVLAERFHQAHERRFGHANPGAPVEVVGVRVAAFGTNCGIELVGAAEEDLPAAAYGHRVVNFGNGDVATALWRRAALTPGATVPGPAIISEMTATTIVPPGELATVDASGVLVITVGIEA